MLLATGLNGLQLVLIGLSILALAFVARRTFVRIRSAGERDVAAEVRREFADAEQSAAGLVRRMEVRLHDFGREAEARLQTRIAVLSELIGEADREISRLQRLLRQCRPDDAAETNAPFSPASERIPTSPGSLPGRRSGPTAAEVEEADPGSLDFLTDPRLRPGQRLHIARLLQSGYKAGDIADLFGIGQTADAPEGPRLSAGDAA